MVWFHRVTANNKKERRVQTNPLTMATPKCFLVVLFCVALVIVNSGKSPFTNKCYVYVPYTEQRNKHVLLCFIVCDFMLQGLQLQRVHRVVGDWFTRGHVQTTPTAISIAAPLDLVNVVDFVAALQGLLHLQEQLLLLQRERNLVLQGALLLQRPLNLVYVELEMDYGHYVKLLL